MDALLDVALTNAAAAAVLALAAALGARLTRRPALVHLFWVMVLARLVTPPVVELAVVPRPEHAPPSGLGSATPAGVPLASVPLDVSPASVPLASVPLAVPLANGPSASAAAGAPPGPAARVRGGAPWLWAMGALAFAALALARIVRFGRLARAAVPAPGELVRRAEDLAARMGLGRPPEVRVTDSSLPPLVWSPFGLPTLLLPRGLTGSLTPAELDAVLAHELAHVKRRDHWVRLLELAACTLFWWHPAAWWARRALRRAEERCCDAWVLRLLPGSARAYAGSLLKTLELSAARPRPLPAVASGIGPTGRRRSANFRSIEERLRMIMKHRAVSPTLPRRALLPAAAAAVLALLVVPTWADRPAPEEAALEEAVPVEASERLERRLELERQSLRLAEERRAMKARELAERAALAQESAHLEVEEVRRRAEALAAGGEAGEAERLRRHAAALERRAALEAQVHELHRARLDGAGGLEIALHRARLEAEAHAARDEDSEAEEARRRAEALARQLEDRAVELMQREAELEQRRLQTDLEHLEAERQRLLNAGEAGEAERLAREADRLRRESEHARAEHELRQRQLRLEADLRDEERAARAALETEVRELERRRVEVAVESELASLRAELPHRLRELRHMLDSVGGDGELAAELDRLESAIETLSDSR